MDDVKKFNKQRWEELSEAGVKYSLPWMDLNEEKAFDLINPERVDIAIRDKDVLCLAASGGQQTAAFGLLGARVTVFDLSEAQLKQDRKAATFYGFPLVVQQGDMSDLSIFSSDSFDLVWLAHGINFISDPGPVIREAARVLRVSGNFRLEITNPYGHGIWERWNGEGYLVTEPFIDGGEVVYDDPYWEFDTPSGERKRVRGPREFRHSLSRIVNSLISNGLRVLGLWEDGRGDPEAEPGSWKHFKSRIPPWITIWTELDLKRGREGRP
jgi:SAM-dependent methyltransferase